MVMTLQIPAMIFDEMVEHARSELPHECVGMLLGQTDGQATHYIALVNELQSPTRFLTEAMSMLRAEKKRRELNLEVLAIVHSHPTSDPIPSQYDKADHYSSDVVCLILSLKEKEPNLQGWWINPDGVMPASVVVQQATA
ncbi:MAG: M67 family metallopeptidase [Planctomycetia bacterium]|nr:M67 family metallopeptidase [Planctomycetia bacterium]